MNGLPEQGPRPYHDVDSFHDWAFYHRLVTAPFNAIDKICFGHFDLMASHWAKLADKRDAQPMVSVILPVYNRQDLLARAVRSVLAQTHAAWELIIVDDGSEPALDLSELVDPRIVHLRLPTNRGQAAARNAGLQRARGSYIAYLDSDNWWDPRYLAVMTERLAAHPEHAAAYCGQYLFAPSGDRAIAVRIGPFNPSLMDNENFIDIGCLVHERTLLAEVGEFCETLRAVEDWDFVRRICDARAPLFVPTILSSYDWRRDDSVSASGRTEIAVPQALALQREAATVRCFDTSLHGTPLTLRSAPIDATLPRARNISIIIPSYQVAEELRLCVDRVFDTIDGEACEVIICDNGSSAPTLEALQELQWRHPKLKIDRNDVNAGFTHAVNRGLRLADPDNDVVLLNNDAIVTDGWLEAMYAVCASDPSVGVVAPQQVLLPDTPTIKAHAPYASTQREIDVNLSAHHENAQWRTMQADGRMTLGFVPFFCVLITRRALDAVGELSERFGPHYRSDSYFCLGLRDIAGLRVAYTPRARVYHLLQRATHALRDRNSEEYSRLFEYNRYSSDPATWPVWDR